jgi:hypothetical protein
MRRHVDKHGPPPATSDKLIQGFDPLMGGLQVNPNRFDRWLGGVSGEGGADSVAGRLWRAARPGGETSCAVTDRRLLLLSEAKLNSGEYRIVFEAPRTAVASAARRGKPGSGADRSPK